MCWIRGDFLKFVGCSKGFYRFSHMAFQVSVLLTASKIRKSGLNRPRPFSTRLETQLRHEMRHLLRIFAAQQGVEDLGQLN